MEKTLERLNAEFDEARRQSRVDKIEEIIHSFHSSLLHPHDFSPSEADVCWIPEVRDIITDTKKGMGDCVAEIQLRLPELSTTWLEERRKVFLELLPQTSPTLEHLSLATTLFDCMECPKFGMRIEDALSHRCYCSYYDKRFPKFSSNVIAEFYCYRVHLPWNSGFAKYRYSADLSALVREIVLECGEDPDTITTKEMNRKHHRLACFGTNGEITVLSWFQAVSSKASALDDAQS